ncbi:energy transducer TonB [Gluconacetobacter tumulisoli]|uniref:Energy transducer TonB n=1 Tax=Gluconacetobacter tumulisoli TaxID=1286189 RepID=A0A7W4PM60_9PROT|nr:energy transducer TonB [Gluconacetobacter tumulisoli]MBB2202855.1 energy transducer TonB [Gluconacetobacter tumulisoli]
MPHPGHLDDDPPEPQPMPALLPESTTDRPARWRHPGAILACFGVFLLLSAKPWMATDSGRPFPPSALPLSRLPATHGPRLNRLASPRLLYPEVALKLYMSGQVSIDCTIHADGMASACRIVRSTDPVFNASSLSYVAHARFFPAIRNGQPVETRDYSLTVRYVLRR